MSTVTMSLTRLLAEIKRTEKKIQEGSAAQVCMAAKGQEDKMMVVPLGAAVDKAKELLQSNYDRVSDLITNRNLMKNALIKANGETTVVIGNTSMTIAEAIDTKNTIAIKENLLNNWRTQRNQCNLSITQMQKVMEDTIEKQVLAMAGGDKKNISTENVEVVTRAQHRLMAPSMVDPNKIDDKIKALNDEILDFKTNVDYSLSEVNAKTVISVELV